MWPPEGSQRPPMYIFPRNATEDEKRAQIEIFERLAQAIEEEHRGWRPISEPWVLPQTREVHVDGVKVWPRPPAVVPWWKRWFVSARPDPVP